MNYYITSFRRGQHFRLQGGRSTRLQRGWTPLQASDKFHVFQPRFLTINPSNSTIFLDTFWIHFAYKGVENGNPLISEKATPLRTRYFLNIILIGQRRVGKSLLLSFVAINKFP
ncbi:Hypothetical_protein [Hexamita inflata]|uniref:Hypothetical_protein n=1 Tax=Hexamita inflata TaxID=28002 RepID=A0AA86UCH8_9EUKA|nr:Hypothetical protein HINF_LOCUS33227 [Hexamita inflata]